MLKKYFVLLMLGLIGLFVWCSSAYADDMTSQYDVQVRGFYWDPTVKTPNYTATGSGYGLEADIRDKSADMSNWGLGIEYTSSPNGPRFVNTGGVSTTSFAGFTGYSVSLGSSGTFGLVSQGTIQMGGARLKYFFPTTVPGFNAAIYGDYFTSTGSRTAIGGGAEADWDVAHKFSLTGHIDLNNVAGNSFPNQTLTRYELIGTYHIPQTQVDVFAGYRGNSYTRFYNTTVNGPLLGVGGHF